MKIYCVKCADATSKSYEFADTRKKVLMNSRAKRFKCQGCGFEIVIEYFSG